jgi:hypothetical protein
VTVHRLRHGCSRSTTTAVGRVTPWLVVVVAAAVGACGSGCATAPAYRPVGPPMLDAVFEGGVGVHGIAGAEYGGGGTALWATGQLTRDVALIARAHVADGVRWDGTASTLQWGASAGFRGTYVLRPSLLVGGDVSVDYLQLATSDGTLQQFASGIAAFPVAEEALPGLWVYVQPAIGAGFRFGDVDVPFGGFTEMPIGVAWRALPWLLIVGEGGLSLPFSGGYVGVGAALRL